MALNESNFDVCGSGSKGSVRIHTYSTTDAIATVEGANYFDALEDVLQTGDVIYAHMSDGNKFYKVTNTAGVITLPTEIAFA